MSGWVDGWMDGWGVDGWMDKWVAKQMNGWTDVLGDVSEQIIGQSGEWAVLQESVSKPHLCR